MVILDSEKIAILKKVHPRPFSVNEKVELLFWRGHFWMSVGVWQIEAIYENHIRIRLFSAFQHVRIKEDEKIIRIIAHRGQVNNSGAGIVRRKNYPLKLAFVEYYQNSLYRGRKNGHH